MDIRDHCDTDTYIKIDQGRSRISRWIRDGDISLTTFLDAIEIIDFFFKLAKFTDK